MNNGEFNKIGLYQHNIESYKKIREAFDSGEKVVGIVHATGTGKSYNALQLAFDNKDKKIIYVVPSIGIIEHVNKIIQDNPELNMQRDFPNLEFRTYQSFINMSEEELENLDVDLLIIDEFHHLGAPIWGARINKIVETHKDMQIFGMTAYTVRDRGTAYERDMANLETDELFSNKIVSRYDLCDAMIDELLPQPIYKTAYVNLLELEQELEEKIKTMSITPKEYQEYIRILDIAKKRIAEAPSIPELIRKNIKRNGKYIYFCPPGSQIGTNDIETIKKEAMEWFKRYIPEEDIIFYETTSEMGNLGRRNRDAFYNDTTLTGESVQGKLRVMFAINQYNEGVHAPNIDGVIMGRGTTSDIVYFEQLGRALSVRGNTRQEYEKFEKYDISELIQLCKYRDIFIDKNATKEEIIQKLIAPVIIDLTNNFEFIQELENNLKARVKEVQNISSGDKTNSILKEVSFDIEVFNKDLFQMLSNLKKRLTPISWEEMYALAEKYYRHYGNLDIPQKFRTKNGVDVDEFGINLGMWLSSQKDYYKNQHLSNERLDKLLKIGFAVKTMDDAWEEWFILAKNYYLKYGNLTIPMDFKTTNGIDFDENGVNLGRWIQYQRRRYLIDKLSEEKINKLLEIGMNFNPKFSIRPWEEIYELAKKNYLHYGYFNIPLTFKTTNGIDYDPNGFGLGHWIGVQRDKYKKNQLSEEKTQKLLEIGMEFHHDLSASIGDKMYELATIYFKHYGNLEIASSFKTTNGIDYDENGQKLGAWIQDQREKYKNGKLSNKRYNMLLKIGMRFEATYHDDHWDELYLLAEKYYEHYGNLEVPFYFKTTNGIDFDEEGIKLGRWISDQRSKYKKKTISEERIQKLSKIGMIFTALIEKMPWNEWYEYARKYYSHYGNLKIPQKFKTKDGINYDEEGISLGMWINTQRTRYRQEKLSQDRIKKLEEIGIVWDISKNRNDIVLLCYEYGIDWYKNTKVLNRISVQEFIAKIKYLLSSGMPLCDEERKVHEVFSMSNANMIAKYGVSIEELIEKYYDNTIDYGAIIDEKRKKGI